VESPSFADHTRAQPRRIAVGARPRGGWTEGPDADALVLGRYRLSERLGAGGFGVVWSAHDELLRRNVAVKRVPLAPGEDGERVTREALASARLSHPAIVALYEACPVQDAFYLISELVDGDTLARLIADDALDDEQVLRIGAALCSALEHAHARGVVHRDVKPHNVLVPREHDADTRRPEAFAGVAKLTDFGGARLSGQDVLTRTGDVLGTLAYMAPEQSEGRDSGEPVDVYALALVLYEALCGFNPVRGATPAQTARRIGRPVRPLARTRRDLPRELTQAIDRCLQPSPTDRAQICELSAALEDALEGAAPPGGPRLVPPARRLRTRRAASAPSPTPSAEELPARAAIVLAPMPSHSEPAPRAQSEAAGLPRLIWLAAALALAGWQAAAGRPGLGLLALAALLPIVLLPVGRRAQGGSGGWLLCLLAPLLGCIGLAGAFPALAGQPLRWRMRAAFGAIGYWWLALAEPLLARRLWLGPPAGTPPRAVWEGSLDGAAVHVIWPLISSRVLLGALLWAGGAALLPLLVRGRSAAIDVLAATMWSAALVTAAPILAVGSHAGRADATPRGALLGALLGGALAVAARALRGPV
jgi:serine/threonine protein kinase